MPKAAVRPDALAGTLGHLGTAHPLALLATLVAGAKAGTKCLLAAGGDGADAWCLAATADLPPLPPPGPTVELAHYGAYLRSRGLLPGQPASTPFTSPAMLQREDWLRWHGRKCAGCGMVEVLPLATCHRCRGERFETVPLGRVGTVFAATREWYVPSPEPPTGMAVIDLDGGGRATLQVADAPPDVVAVGARVRLVLRKYHEASGWPHYFWKAMRIA